MKRVERDGSLSVLHVVGPMNPGGMEVMVMELLRNKGPDTRLNFVVHVRDARNDPPAFFDREIEARGSKLFKITTPSKTGPFAYLREFRALVAREGKPDVVHIHLNARSGVVALAAWLSRIPRIIVHSHAALTFRGSLVYRLACRAELFLSRGVFTFLVSDFWGCSDEAIKSLFPKLAIALGRRTHVVNNAIAIEDYMSVNETDVASVRKEFGCSTETLFIGCVGRIVRHKDAARLIRALWVLRERGVQAMLVIVGREQDGAYVHELRELVAELKLQEHVVWAGERSDICKVMASLDVFASPALKEGFGLVALEAQAAGTPCVLSSGFPRSVDVGLGLVRFLRDAEPEEWAAEISASAIRRCVQTADIRKAFSDAGFMSSVNTSRVESAYRDPNVAPSSRRL